MSDMSNRRVPTFVPSVVITATYPEKAEAPTSVSVELTPAPADSRLTDLEYVGGIIDRLLSPLVCSEHDESRTGAEPAQAGLAHAARA